jgi:hypothetical protein
MINRLLFAAARGARIQEQRYTQQVWWKVCEVMPIVDMETDYDYRIHPEDAHLEYGTISTALRERVRVGPFKAKDFDLAWQYVKARFPEYYKVEDGDLFTAILILAEFFADEGL